jgi:hypothetical protein
LSSLSSVIQNNRILASFVSVRLANTTNLKYKKNRGGHYKRSHYTVHPKKSDFRYLAINGTCIASRYSSVAILDASATFRQSISQNRAETVVVNDTQSLINVRGVEPVTSSHCALDVPPTIAICTHAIRNVQHSNICIVYCEK